MAFIHSTNRTRIARLIWAKRKKHKSNQTCNKIANFRHFFVAAKIINLINFLCNLRLIWFAISCIEHCVLVSLFRNISRFNCMASTIVCHNLLNTILIYFGVAAAAAVTFFFLPFCFTLLLLFLLTSCSLVFYSWFPYFQNNSLLQCRQYPNPYRSVGFCFESRCTSAKSICLS